MVNSIINFSSTNYQYLLIQVLEAQGGRGWGYSGFQLTGMGIQIDFGIFFGVGKFGKYFFGWLNISRDFWGITNLGCVTANKAQSKCSWVPLLLLK